MLGAHHVALARAVCEALKVPRGDIIAQYADFPDRVGDVYITGVGTTIVGRQLCSLTHYCVPTSRRTFRGYAWKRDDSVPHLNLPDRDVRCLVDRWTGVSKKHRAEHPLVKLLAVEGYTHAADEMTWPTAAAMADWLAHDPEPSYQTIGASLHFVQDACVRHHACGWLMYGHGAYEATLQEFWYKLSSSGPTGQVLARIRTKGRMMGPRSAVEMCARRSAEWALAPTDGREFAILATAAALRWWMERMK